jgi:hypothetical protein
MTDHELKEQLLWRFGTTQRRLGRGRRFLRAWRRRSGGGLAGTLFSLILRIVFLIGKGKS